MIGLKLLGLCFPVACALLMTHAQKNKTGRINSERPKLVNPEAMLLDYLFKDYDKDARPFLENREAVQVKVSLALGRITQLNERQQILTSFGWLPLEWKDPYLSWNPSDYAGISRVVVDSSRIWMPEVALLNTVEEGNDLSLETKFRAVIRATGTTRWLPGIMFVTTCPVDLTYFPFDIQTCKIKVITWSFTDELVNFTVPLNNVTLNFYQPNDEWDLIETHAHRDNLSSAPVASFTIVMKRKPLFYMLNIISPCVIMSLMSIMVFPLPVEAGEKVSLNISLLLSFSVLMLLVSDIMPKNAEAIPILAIFLTTSMALTGLSLLCTVGVLNIHHHNPHTQPLPGFVRTIFLRGLGRILCMRAAYNVRPNSNTVEPIRNGRGEIVSDVQAKDIPDQPKSEATVNDFKKRGVCVTKQAAWDDNEGISEQDDVNEWRLLASLLDRFFLVLFALTSVVTIVTIMGILHSEH